MQLHSCEKLMNVMLLRRCLVNSPFKVFGSPLPTRKKVSRQSTFFRHVATISSWNSHKNRLVLLASIKIPVAVKVPRPSLPSQGDNVISERDNESVKKKRWLIVSDVTTSHRQSTRSYISYQLITLWKRHDTLSLPKSDVAAEMFNVILFATSQSCFVFLFFRFSPVKKNRI